MAKIGINDKEFLKTSRRAIVDAQLKKDMPSLEFNRLHDFDTQYSLFEPYEMAWSGSEHIKETHQQFILQKQEQRAIDKIAEMVKHTNMVIKQMKREAGTDVEETTHMDEIERKLNKSKIHNEPLEE